MSRAEKAEAVVVGSGAAGSIVAARLAAAGRRVVILEAGPARSNTDLISSQIWARRLKWSGAPVLEAGEDPIGFTFNAGFGTGGSALHHFAVWPRLHEEDFRCRSLYDRGLDWPIEYAQLRPWYERVQREAGIAGDAQREVWRPPADPYPMPGVPTFAQGRVIERGFAALGLSTAPLPLAVTTRSYDGRAPCIWDGWCDAGCPIGALANPLTVHLPKALQAGATLQTDATVVRILTSADGGRATGVEYVDGRGERRSQLADVVVLAAFAVQNPRLLLTSATDRHPRGLGNSHDLVGRYLMTHPAGLVYGLFDEDTEPHRGAFGGQLLNQDAYGKLSHRDAGAFGSYQWMIAQAVRPNDLLGIGPTRADLFGADLQAFMRRAVRSFAGMTAVVEDLPVADNRVGLDERRDAHGVPLARTVHTTHPQSKQLWRRALAEGERIFRAAGARQVWTGPQGAMHIMGGTIMGRDARSSVTNEYGQLYDVPNLIVAGPGLFPTSGGVNPTFTVQALALRTAERLLSNWGPLT